MQWSLFLNATEYERVAAEPAQCLGTEARPGQL